jgi:hypothetical protein
VGDAGHRAHVSGRAVRGHAEGHDLVALQPGDPVLRHRDRAPQSRDSPGLKSTVKARGGLVMRCDGHPGHAPDVKSLGASATGSRIRIDGPTSVRYPPGRCPSRSRREQRISLPRSLGSVPWPEAVSRESRRLRHPIGEAETFKRRPLPRPILLRRRVSVVRDLGQRQSSGSGPLCSLDSSSIVVLNRRHTELAHLEPRQQDKQDKNERSRR